MKEINKGTYQLLVQQLVEVIESERYKAYRSLNRHSISLNFQLGKLIVGAQMENGWGKSVVDNISKDIISYTGGIKGFSPQNLWNMRQFYNEYKDDDELLELCKNVPWSHNMLIIRKIGEKNVRKYYLQSVIDFGWSRAVLQNQIMNKAFERQISKSTQNNFLDALPKHLNEQAIEALKSEYNLDFLGVSGPILEKELESLLINNIKDLVMELGYGFCYIGNQYKLKLNKKEYFLDLLFYHRILKCLVIIDLKIVEFEPEFAGKMNFYLELVDKQLRQADDNPSIGIILCPEKDEIEVEYALRTSAKPIGVSEYKFTSELPDELKGKLPSSEEFKKLIDKHRKK